MDIAVQVSPMKDNSTTLEENKLSVEKQLIMELEKMFHRENLQNNSYLIYRMTNNLEISFDAIINENKIKSISQDPSAIIAALKKTPNVEVNEKKNIIIPIIPTQQNKIIISNIEDGVEEELKEFLLQGVADQDCEFLFDRKNCCRVIFKNDTQTAQFFDWITGKSFHQKPLHAYYEPENLYITFLQNIQEKKHQKNEAVPHPMYYSGMPGPYGYFPDPNAYPAPMMDPYFAYMPYNFDAYRYGPPPYYGNFFIRKASDEDEDSDENNDYEQNKKKYNEKKERYHPKEYNYSYASYKPKQYSESYRRYEKHDRYYQGKNSSQYHDYYEDKGSYDYNKNKSKDYKEYKEKKPYESSKKTYSKGKNKPHGSKYYYEPKQVKDVEFPPLVVKEEKKIEVTVPTATIVEENKKEIEKSGIKSYGKKEIVEIFQSLKNQKKITRHPALENPNEEIIHLVEKEGDIRLEFLDPKAVKIPTSTNTTPLMTGLSRPAVIPEEKKE